MARRILVGCDHTEEAEAGLRRAAALAGSARAELTVVHVAVPPPAWATTGVMAVPLLEDVVATGEALVRKAVDELPQDLAVRWHLVSGPDAAGGFGRHRCVRRALQRVLDGGEHDLLVLGTGVTPGRVARALLRRCPDRVVTAPFAAGDAAIAASGAPALLRSLSAK